MGARAAASAPREASEGSGEERRRTGRERDREPLPEGRDRDGRFRDLTLFKGYLCRLNGGFASTASMPSSIPAHSCRNVSNPLRSLRIVRTRDFYANGIGLRAREVRRDG